jgi:transmembrane sensor
MNVSTPSLDPAAEETAALWAARLDGATLSPAARADLDAWLAEHPAHRVLLSQYCQLNADLERQLPLVAGDEPVLTSAAYSDSRDTRRMGSRRFAAWAGAALAAAAAVVLLLTLLRPGTQFETVASAVGQRQELTLADGSRVELNAQTALVVHVSRTERRVRLAAGQAFFSVRKDEARPFIVETPAGSVRVTGTQFDVRSETESSLEVVVAEGSVQVRPGGAMGSATPPIGLTAGQKLSASRSAEPHVETLSSAALADALAWRRGQIVFVGTPLREALARFARYHGRGLTATPLAAELSIGGRFQLNDLDGFLGSLEELWPNLEVVQNLNGTVQVRMRSEN